MTRSFRHETHRSHSVVRLPRPGTTALRIGLWLAVLSVAALRPASAVAEPTLPNGVLVTVAGKRALLRQSGQAPMAASTVLGKEELSHPGDNASDVLRQVPGVQITRTGATTDPATASIRGADAKQVPVYLAGVRLNDEVNGAADLSTIPLWMMQRVEIFRGNAPAYQADIGQAGAIYFEPLRPTVTRLGAEAHVGSFGRGGGSVSAQVGNNQSATLVSLRASSVRNNYSFLNDHGLRYSTTATEDRRVNADAHDVDGWVVGSHALQRVRLNTILHVFDREQGTSGIATTPARAARAHNRRLLAAVSGSYSCPTSWSCLVLAQASWLMGQETLRDPDRELRTLRAEWLYSRGTRSTVSARAELGVTDYIKVTPVAAVAVDRLEIDTPGTSPRTASRSTSTLGVEATAKATSSLSLFGMVRGACYDTDAEYVRLSRLQRETVSRCPAAPDARIGVEWALAEPLRLLANVGHTWREPTLGERYGVSAALQGNPELDPERTRSVDLGTRGSGRLGEVGFEWDLFVFRRLSEDLVRYRQTSLYAFSPYNVGETVISGGEVAIATQLPLGFATQSTLTVLDPRDTTEGRRGGNQILPMTSRLTTYHDLRWTYSAHQALFRETTLAARYFYRASRYADPAGLVVLPEMHSLDAHATVSLSKPNLDLSFSANNLFDQRIVDYLGLPTPGRSFYASMSCWW